MQILRTDHVRAQITNRLNLSGLLGDEDEDVTTYKALVDIFVQSVTYAVIDTRELIRLGRLLWNATAKHRHHQQRQSRIQKNSTTTNTEEEDNKEGRIQKVSKYGVCASHVVPCNERGVPIIFQREERTYILIIVLIIIMLYFRHAERIPFRHAFHDENAFVTGSICLYIRRA
jgi:hypothetical protein